MTDDEIKAAILEHFRVEFQNFNGDNLLEGPCNSDEDAYNRAVELLPGARLMIVWPGDPVDPRLRCGCLAFASKEFRPGIDEPPY